MEVQPCKFVAYSYKQLDSESPAFLMPAYTLLCPPVVLGCLARVINQSLCRAAHANNGLWDRPVSALTKARAARLLWLTLAKAEGNSWCSKAKETGWALPVVGRQARGLAEDLRCGAGGG